LELVIPFREFLKQETMKNNIIILLILFISTIPAFAQETKTDNFDFPVLKGTYLGQTPPGLVPEIFASGIISTDKGELNAIFSPDGKEFYFTIEVVPGRSYTTYFMQQENNVWSEPKVEPLLLNYKGGEPSISPDGKYLFFRSMLDENGNDQSNADIWRLNRNSNNSNKLIKIGIAVNSKFNEAYPTLSNDNTLYFHSNRKGGKGGADIYFSNFANENYIGSTNIGDSINSETQEFHPCISPDGNYIIFTSLKRPDGVGGLDLYISFRKKDESWTKAKNLGKNINSEANDYMPYISYDGKYLFFTSTRINLTKNGNESINSTNHIKGAQYGKPDIYWVSTKIIDELKSNYLR